MPVAESNSVLRVGGILLTLSLLFPPWAYTYQTTGISEVRKPAGYGFLFVPPSPEGSHYAKGIVLDWSRLTAQIGLIGLLTGGAWFAFRHANQLQ